MSIPTAVSSRRPSIRSARPEPEVNLSDPQPRSSARLYWICFGAVIALHLAVIWIPAYNGIVDLPYHLARAWAMHHYADIPFLQNLFLLDLKPMPNLAIDLLVPPLLSVLSPIPAAKVFLSLLVLLFAAGCHLAGQAFYGRPVWTAPAAACCVFNATYLFGFVNSVAGSAFFLLAFALWMRFRARWTPLRWAVFALLILAAYLSHLSGFVFTAMAIGIVHLRELPARRPDRGDLTGWLAFLPAVAVHVYPWSNKVHMNGEIIWAPLRTKLIALGSCLFAYQDWASLLILLLAAAGLAIAFTRGGAGFGSLPAWLAIAFFAACLLSPSQITSGGGSAAEARFPPPATVFLLLAIPAVSPRGAQRIALALLYGALLFRLGNVGWNLLETSRAAEQQLVALDQVAPQTTILEIFLESPDRQTGKRQRGNIHLPSYALIRRQAVSSDFWGVRGVQPLYFRHQEDWPVSTETPKAFQPQLLDRRLPRFDYIWGCNLDAPHRGYVSAKASLVAAADICELWKINR